MILPSAPLATTRRSSVHDGQKRLFWPTPSGTPALLQAATARSASALGADHPGVERPPRASANARGVTDPREHLHRAAVRGEAIVNLAVRPRHLGELLQRLAHRLEGESRRRGGEVHPQPIGSGGDLRFATVVVGDEPDESAGGIRLGEHEVETLLEQRPRRIDGGFTGELTCDPPPKDRWRLHG